MLHYRLRSPSEPQLQQIKLTARHCGYSRNRRRLRTTTRSNHKEIATIIVDHGSRRQESNEQLEQFVSMYREANDSGMVVAAHMEIASPSIEDAVRSCVEAGYKSLVVAPYFLSNGRHIQQDIPALVAQAQAQHTGIDCVIADPIGIDIGVVDIIRQRVQTATRKQGAQ